MAQKRLQRRDWIRAALTLLAESNVNAVLIPPLAKRLGVTKGSFYWHFSSREELLDAVLDEWHTGITARVRNKVEFAASTPADRLRALFNISSHASIEDFGGALELAIRNWARVDKRARAMISKVDAERLDYIAGLYRALGYSAGDEAKHRAFAQYAYSMGSRSLFGVDKSARDQYHDACFKLLSGITKARKRAA